MSNLILLNTEVDTDPRGRGFSGMTSQQVADDLNDDTLGNTRNRTSMTPSEVYQNVDDAQWTGLSDAAKQEVWDILHLGDPLDPFGREAGRFIVIFGAGSATILALQAARVENISPAVDLGIGFVTAGDVEYVRAN